MYLEYPNQTIMDYRLLVAFILMANQITATTWQVGPTRSYLYCSQVAPLVQDGDTVAIDFAVYVNDPQVEWTANNLYIVGVGGRPRLEAGSIIANDVSNGKGIFVTSGAGITIENIEFALAQVPDHNGAGIRQQGPDLQVINCRFDGNEMGILAGNISNCTTIIEYTEFLNGGSALNPGYQHNVYINHIDTLVFRYNYSHDAIAEGHELKSRANYNFIEYNRIANETSVDSRTIDLPNGGTSVIVGNIVEQGPNSANSNLLGYGLEGLTNPAPHALYVAHNTFVNKKPTGSFIQLANGTDSLYLCNNILAGAHTGGYLLGTPDVLDSTGNMLADLVTDPGFVDPVVYDYHLQAGSSARDHSSPLNKVVLGHSLDATLEYVDQCDHSIRPSDGIPDAGAFEYNSPVSIAGPAVHHPYPFPNPCTDRLILQQAPSEEYEVLDASGRCLLSGNGNEVPTNRLSPGWYILKTKSGQSRFIRE